MGSMLSNLRKEIKPLYSETPQGNELPFMLLVSTDDHRAIKAIDTKTNCIVKAPAFAMTKQTGPLWI